MAPRSGEAFLFLFRQPLPAAQVRTIEDVRVAPVMSKSARELEVPWLSKKGKKEIGIFRIRHTCRPCPTVGWIDWRAGRFPAGS